ncbi:hypothetical protein BDK51DRAFT_32821 [Blyttiomyces helicus]|uniref:Uncharacterized protein n=1 Tax=Blyttiomyces helicus TaxID=388810 RepID=A0A4P9WP43_9FUNG|nr:hypothetical protein BDK51DRAFT_32821 [Blyttiomyces helicus]|eukprot:RKO93883.1 hypothetical protein BDK51DRAFT_32821 [Blyttiomyces helicus]
MGGLLAVDSTTALRSEASVVNVVCVVTFNSPFFGVRKELISDKAQLVLSVPSYLFSPIWITFAIVCLALFYISNKNIKKGLDQWSSEQQDNVAKYVQFLAPLWNIEGMKKRFDALGRLNQPLVFKYFYGVASLDTFQQDRDSWSWIPLLVLPVVPLRFRL